MAQGWAKSLGRMSSQGPGLSLWVGEDSARWLRQRRRISSGKARGQGDPFVPCSSEHGGSIWSELQAIAQACRSAGGGALPASLWCPTQHRAQGCVRPLPAASVSPRQAVSRG